MAGILLHSDNQSDKKMSDNLPVISPSGIDAIRLRDIKFTDLFIGENGKAFMRGLEETDEALSGVPAGTIDDLDRLQRKVCSIGQEKDEFFLKFDDMHFRVTKIEDVEGVWYTLRRAMFPIPRLKVLGVDNIIVQALGMLGRSSQHGLILIAGKTGQGKTTTASALLREYLLHFGDVAVTIEDPVELPLNGPHGKSGYCFQTAVKDGDFKGAMSATMRRAPRYIMLGEIRGKDEASEAIKAASNGHIVISTIHAGNCREAINGLLKFVSGSENLELARAILADGLAAVIHQQMQTVGGTRRLKMEWLFPYDDTGIRSKIRSGNIEQLATDIENQRIRVVMQKKLPFDRN